MTLSNKPSEAELRERTAEILRNVEQLSAQLTIQTERLAATLDQLNAQVVHPLKAISSSEEQRGEY